MLRRRWMIFAGAAILVVGYFISVGIREQSSGDAQLRAARERARSEGIPLSIEEFQSFVGPDPGSRNAWPLYEEAIRTYRPEIFDAPSAENPAPSRTGLNELSGALREWRQGGEIALSYQAQEMLKELLPALEKVREASERPELWIPREWSQGILATVPELMELLRLGRVIMVRALIESREQGPDRLLDGVDVVSRIVNHLAQQPISTYQSIAAALASDGLEALQREVSRDRIPPARFNDVREAAAKLAGPFELRRAFQGFVGLSLISLDILSSRTRMLEEGFDDRWALRNVPKPEAGPETEREILRHASQILERWPEDAADLFAMKEALGTGDEEIEEALRVFSPMFRQRLGRTPEGGPFVQILATLETHQARLRLLRGVMAALEGRERNGEFPETLPLEGRDAADPFTGKDLKYRRTQGGFVMYSVGRNRADDGGIESRVEGRPSDIVVKYPGGGSAL